MVESIQHQRIKGNHFLDRCHVSIQVSHDLGHGNIHESRVQRAYERRRGDNNHWHRALTNAAAATTIIGIHETFCGLFSLMIRSCLSSVLCGLSGFCYAHCTQNEKKGKTQILIRRNRQNFSLQKAGLYGMIQVRNKAYDRRRKKAADEMR